MLLVSATGQHNYVCHGVGDRGPVEALAPCTDQEHFVSGMMFWASRIVTPPALRLVGATVTTVACAVARPHRSNEPFISPAAGHGCFGSLGHVMTDRHKAQILAWWHGCRRGVNPL